MRRFSLFSSSYLSLAFLIAFLPLSDLMYLDCLSSTVEKNCSEKFFTLFVRTLVLFELNGQWQEQYVRRTNLKNLRHKLAI
jgi:hypothetical protein